MRRTLVLLVSSLFLVLAAPACVAPVEEANRECPCTGGWSCCEGVCLPPGSYCPPPPPPPDLTAPDAPRLEQTDPASPTRATTVTLSGVSEARALVQLYAAAACAGDVVGEVIADANGVFLAEVPLSPDATTAFTALAVDEAGNASPCSPGALEVTHDQTPPTAPRFDAQTSDAPSPTQVELILSGVAEPGAEVVLHADATCTQPLEYAGVANAEGVFRVWARAQANAATSFYAVAIDTVGNVSPCSEPSAPFVHDDLPPEPPVLTEASPSSPSRVPDVQWVGTAEPGARVRLFADAECLVVASAELIAAAAGTWAVDFTAEANAVTRRWGRAVDAAGNASACAEVGSHVHDDVAPDFPRFSLSEPPSPGNVANIALKGSSEPGARIRIYLSAKCEGAPVGEAITDAYRRFSAPVTVSQPSTSFNATAEDPAGNVSVCSYFSETYVYDTTPPAPPSALTFSEPTPLASAPPAPVRLLGRTETGTQVEVFSFAGCDAESRVPTLVRAGFGSELFNTRSFQFPLPEAELQPWRSWSVRAIDEAGNVSRCVSAGALALAQPDGRAWRPLETPPVEYGQLWFDGQSRLYLYGSNAGDPVGNGLHRRAAGGGWEHLRTWSSGSAHLAVDPAGNVLVLRAASGTITVSRYDADSGGWDDATLSTVGQLDFGNSVAIAPDGRGWVCWFDVTPNPAGPPPDVHAVRCASSLPGEPWVISPVLATHRFLYEVRPLPGTDGRARVTWVWGDGETSEWQLRTRSFDLAAGWGAETTLAVSDGMIEGSVSEDGTAWMTWAARDPEGGWSVWVRRSPPDAQSWTPPERLAHSAQEFELPTPVGGTGEEVVVTWRERTAVANAWLFRLHLAHHTPGEGWTTTEVPVAGPGLPALHRVGTAGPGRAWLFWREGLRVIANGVEMDGDIVVARSWDRELGVGPLQVLAIDPLLGASHWGSFGAHSYATDPSGRAAVAVDFDPLNSGNAPVSHVVRVLE